MDTEEPQAPPGDDEFTSRLAASLAARERGDLPGAIDGLRALFSHDSSSWGLRCELAFTLHMAGAYDEAERLCLAVVEEGPAFPPALACLGHIEQKRGRAEEALGWYRRTVEAGLRTPGILMEMAGCLMALSRFGEAEGVCYEVLTSEPESKAALHGLAQANRGLGRRAAALYFFRALARADPDDFATHCEMGAALAELERLDEAQSAYWKALGIAPDHPAPYRGLAHVARLRGRAAEAADILGEARKRGLLEAEGLATLASALAEIAAARVSEGRTVQAVEILGRALQADPDNFEACLLLARLARQNGRYPAALKLGEAMTRAHSARIEGFAETCRTLVAAGQSARAADLARHLASAELPNADRHALRLEVARACLDADLAREALAEVDQEAESGFDVWAGAVETRLAFGDAPGAKSAMDRGPPPGSPFETAGALRLEARLASLEWRLEAAREGFEAAVAMHADDPDSHADLSRLYFLRADVEASMRHLRIYLEQSAAERVARGLSTRPSQNLIGQLNNELRTDPELLAMLLDFRAGDGLENGEAAIGPLLSVVRQFPDATPPAMWLLLALRRAGLLAPGASASGVGAPSSIPRTVMQVWTDGVPPAPVWRAMQACRELNSDLGYAFFDGEAARDYLRRRLPADVQAAYEQAAAGGQADRLFALAWLYNEGGYHLAASDLAIGPLAISSGGYASLVAYQDAYSSIGAGLLACAPGEPVIGSALAMATAALNRGDNDIPWLAIGPGLITRAFAQVMSDCGPGWRAWLAGVCILDRPALAQILIPSAVLPA